jgi:arsenate reductase
MKRRILFLCTANSARSILAEATLRAWGGDRLEVFSAGSRPAGVVNPHALAQLEAEGFDTEGLRSKSWDEFTTVDAPRMDVVVTVCDSAANETCPIVLGDFVRTHWGLPDPAAVDGDAGAQREAFRQVHHMVKARLQALLNVPAAAWDDRPTLKVQLDRIGCAHSGENTTGDV